MESRNQFAATNLTLVNIVLTSKAQQTTIYPVPILWCNWIVTMAGKDSTTTLYYYNHIFELHLTGVAPHREASGQDVQVNPKGNFNMTLWAPEYVSRALIPNSSVDKLHNTHLRGLFDSQID